MSGSFTLTSYGTDGFVNRTIQAIGGLNITEDSTFITFDASAIQTGIELESQNSGGLVFWDSDTSRLTSSPNVIYNGNQLELTLTDSYGGLKLTSTETGGEVSLSFTPKGVTDGSSGQWIIHTDNGDDDSSGLLNFYAAGVGDVMALYQGGNLDITGGFTLGSGQLFNVNSGTISSIGTLVLPVVESDPETPAPGTIWVNGTDLKFADSSGTVHTVTVS